MIWKELGSGLFQLNSLGSTNRQKLIFDSKDFSLSEWEMPFIDIKNSYFSGSYENCLQSLGSTDPNIIPVKISISREVIGDTFSESKINMIGFYKRNEKKLIIWKNLFNSDSMMKHRNGCDLLDESVSFL